MTPDLERLRRFALSAALVLILYSFAGVELERDAGATVFGIPFIIRTPELLPLGLMIVCIYALVRFYYYAMMLAHSPQRRRKDLLHKMHPEDGYGTYGGSIFFGPREYSTTPSLPDSAPVEAELREIVAAFPKVWKFRPTGEVESHLVTDPSGDSYPVFSARVTIPFACRFAAALQDLDYTLPIWLNAVALLLAVATMVGVPISF